MSDSKPVALPAHLWEALDLMSNEMGVGRDALVAQAVFTLARLNGYVVPGRGLQPGAAAAPAPAPAAPPGLKPAPAAKPPPPAPKPAPAPPKRPAPAPEPEPEPDPEPEPAPEDESNPFDEPAPEDDFQDEQPVDEEPQDDPPPEDELPPEEDPEPAPPPARPAAGGGKQSLTLVMANRDPYKMVTDVVTIGRGKTCEFVIESNRVSREHARILREAGGFVLEDLNSSNGTFFGPNKEKVTRRPIRDGDEFTFGTEKVKFQIRK